MAGVERRNENEQQAAAMFQLSDQQLASSLAAHGINQKQIEKVLQARASLRAEDPHRSSPHMSNEQLNQINASLREVGDNIKGYKQDLADVSARLGGVEQMVAKIDAHGLGHHVTGGGTSIGAQALQALEDNGDVAFQSAVDAAKRGQKPSQFAARVNVDTSIRSALTNEGSATSSGSSYIPSQPDRAGFVGPALRKLRLLDVMPSRPTSSDAVEFIQIQATGDASEQDVEGDTKAGIDIDGVPQRAEIATIAAHTDASKQVLADHAALQQQIDRVIRGKVLSRLEHQLINGTGAQGKINGLSNQATILVPTIGTTPADQIGEALVRMADKGFSPNLVLMNPMDWFRIQITRTNGTDDEYVFGSPTVPVPQALWNTSIVTTPSVAEGTSMVLDTSFTTVLDREQMSVSLSNSHADYFIRNLVKILGELRAGLEVLDTNAIYKFDLTPSSGP